MKQKMTMWQWHQLDHMQIIFHLTIESRDNHANTLSLVFIGRYLPDAQPTVSNTEVNLSKSPSKLGKTHL